MSVSADHAPSLLEGSAALSSASLGVALLGTPKLALANSLIDAFIMRMGLTWLLAAPLGCGFIGIYAAQAAAPAPPALIGFAYLRLWARGNSPEKRLP